MAPTASQTIALRFPSRMGYEQIAADTSASVARIMGFPSERIEGLKTAVREACRNAMEHAHHMNGSLPVEVTLRIEISALHIEVTDQGEGLREAPRDPDLRAMMEEGAHTRGWGLFLIRHLMDDLVFERTPDGRHVVHMVLRHPGPEESGDVKNNSS